MKEEHETTYLDETQKYIETLIGRKLDGIEILIMGVAFIQGMIAENYNRENKNE